ncbi:nucleoside hydrolase [Microbacterium sp.]|uniref:nucleoside hydrolase n=1 Tax=Microbacterium sp. TaxID=51671 RepID=UPI002811102B|nr:nucleoside hydrolase [Microbacterium sp.]
MSATHRAILDTDIGTDVDDLMALALILGTPAIELVGATTVYGDTDLRGRMTKRIAALAGADIAVHAGERSTLSGREVWWAGHEAALYEDLAQERLDGADAVQFLIDTVCAAPGRIDVIAIGPLTNIAAAITRDKRFAAAVRHLWIMGGSFTDDEPEHNLRSDAVAANIVFAAGIPTTVAGLEVTRLISMGNDAVERISSSGSLGKAIEAEIRQWWAFWGTPWNVPHDPVTVLTMTRPDLFRFSVPGSVEILSGAHEGVSRFRPGAGRTRVVEGLDAGAVAEAIVAGITGVPDLARLPNAL